MPTCLRKKSWKRRRACGGEDINTFLFIIIEDINTLVSRTQRR